MANYPYDDPDQDYEESCDHDDYESDILTGDAVCWRCGHRWSMTAAQVNAEIEHQRAYYEWQLEQERPWNRFKNWVRDCVAELRWRWQRLRPRPARQILDDEIPF